MTKARFGGFRSRTSLGRAAQAFSLSGETADADDPGGRDAAIRF